MNQNPKFSMKEVFLKGLTELLVVCMGILFFFIIYKSKDILAMVTRLCSILMPVIIGVVLAYLLAPLVDFFEKGIDGFVSKQVIKLEEKKQKSAKKPLTDNTFFKLLKKEEKAEKAQSRLVAIIITFILIGFIIYLLFSMVAPQIYFNIRRVIYALPWQLNKLIYQIQHMVIGKPTLENIVDNLYNQSQKFIDKWVQQDMMGQVTVLISGLYSVVSSVLNFIIGVIVCIYVLMSKETFARQFKKVVHAFLSDEMANNLFIVLKESDKIFGGFITGKLIDSFIIGVLCFIGATILNFPYVALVSVIIGVTNIIPVFGPYLGAVPCTALIFLADPKKGLIFIIFIIVLQQIDGNIIGPTILGESTGLSPFWVVFSILLGGGLFGIVGMLIGVPTFGVIYYLFKSLVNYQLEKKGKSIS